MDVVFLKISTLQAFSFIHVQISKLNLINSNLVSGSLYTVQ